MERVVVPLKPSEYKALKELCRKYELDLNDCINLAIANLVYIYKGL
ncbi:MAG: hypothetical protein QXP98_09455 [Thermoproteus sp.]